MKKYIMAIDEGTTSARAILFDHSGNIVSLSQKEFTQYFLKPGWVEHDANEIWLAVLACMSECLLNHNIDPTEVEAIGITNQRETTLVWDKYTGMPIYHAIVWQSRQTDEICNQLESQGYADLFQKKTGLRIDPYFSATKIRWILDHVEGGQQKAEEGRLLAGTIDSWLVYCLSGGKVHATDHTNASRTLLYNIYTLQWDAELCNIMHIPMSMLPEVHDSSHIYAYTAPYHFFQQEVPIASIAGDQQAALFGQSCFEAGSIKNTYGTGGFLLMNTGSTPMHTDNGLLTTIACSVQGKIQYALEGSIFVCGSAIQWLRDQLSFFPSSKDSEEYARKADENSGIIVVPAFVGLGAPYWDDACRGAIFGLTRGTTKEDITKATLDALAYQTKDVVDLMQETAKMPITKLRVDGGASRNDYLMQRQADIMQCAIIRGKMSETTALGASRLAGLATGFWKLSDFQKQNQEDVLFEPQMDAKQADVLVQKWKQAVKAARVFE